MLNCSSGFGGSGSETSSDMELTQNGSALALSILKDPVASDTAQSSTLEQVRLALSKLQEPVPVQQLRKLCAMRMASVGPSFDGVMMWSASDVTPTAIGSMPSGSKPFAVICSQSPRIQTTEPPAMWVPRSSVRGFDTWASAEITRAL